MIVIEIVHDNYVRLTRGGKTAEAWLGSGYDNRGRWFFAQHSSNGRYYVGRWLSWRINRAWRRSLSREFWTEIPKATARNAEANGTP